MHEGNIFKILVVLLLRTITESFFWWLHYNRWVRSLKLEAIAYSMVSHDTAQKCTSAIIRYNKTSLSHHNWFKPTPTLKRQNLKLTFCWNGLVSLSLSLFLSLSLTLSRWYENRNKTADFGAKIHLKLNKYFTLP